MDIKRSVTFTTGPTLKNCWFAVYRPTHHFAPYPIFFWMGHFERKQFASVYNSFEIRKIAVCFLRLSLPGDYRVTDEALLAETT